MIDIKKFNYDLKKFLPNFDVQTVLGYDEKTDSYKTHVQLSLGMAASLEEKDSTPEHLVTLVQKQLEDIVRFSALVGKGDPEETPKKVSKLNRPKKAE